MRQVAESSLDYNLDIIEKIISYDEEMTYELLTSQKVMSALLSQ